MKQGMLWYDNINGRKLNERIELAVNYFTQKYGKKPEQCFVNPAMIMGETVSALPIKVIADKKILDYSFSGLKTAFYYQIKDWPKNKINSHLADLAASFQTAVFDTLLRKYTLAIEKYQPKCLLLSGGVAANLELRKRSRELAKKYNLPLYLPFKKELNTDNAAMIALAGYYQSQRGDFANPRTLDIDSRAEL